ncbi:hypothetical protein [Halococcus hamelinensis]|uniref:Uncharacterized protein n=1 Tax=Halococcus hamelinensis 100A6 TaxID=1132509 RepID=M0LWF3_9EURY|nr:hypothetical protein [Halococcus hamelinensis]EMA36425.1 hypothetical protein C447_14236 [Halococcus hamelinensis 100A6]
MSERVLADGEKGEQGSAERPLSRAYARLAVMADRRGWVPGRLLDRYRNSSRLSPIRTLAFWSAIALPAIYLPLFATGLSSGAKRHAFVVLLALNYLAFLAGYDHRP